MELISRDELKVKLERGEDFKLVMVLGEWAYQAAHIPGSLHFNSIEEGLKALSKDDEIVVYCSDPNCIASIAAYNHLVNNGYENVRRYAGGLSDWGAAGYPLEGTSV
ncbi:MAG: rhodanese-like domain-containing protein [Anaerolineales bacterium]|nr:rhodanese-like domain-containing protein [Anaerolineales bacterium]MCK5429565.1 rhodanese-like domain-containing protein [Anaerolineales bacterium]